MPPLLSAIVSTYNSERFMRACLEDLVAQTLIDRMEIIVVDSASPQNERAIVEEFQERYPQIVYMRTDERESLYAAWNRGIRAASGKYVTNANTDDRHRRDALERMVMVLESYPEYGLVYADTILTDIENETFETTQATLRHDWPDFNLGVMLSTSLFTAQPVWRRDVHDQVGYFEPAYRIAGDYDLFGRVAWKFGAVHLREPLGLFLQRSDSLSGKDAQLATTQEILEVARTFRRQIPLEDLYPALRQDSSAEARAAALWDMGNLCALSPYSDFSEAMDYYQEAMRVPGLSSQMAHRLQAMHANNAGILLLCMGDAERARTMLASSTAPEARFNLAEAAQGGGPHPLRFHMMEMEHPVVQAARKTSGLRLDESGGLIRTAEHELRAWEVYQGPNGVPLWEEDLQRAQRQAKEPIPAPFTGEPRLSHDTDSPIHIVMTMYGWAEEGGGTLLPRQIAKALVRNGHRVSVIYTAARTMPDKPPYHVEISEDDGVELFAVYNRPALFYDADHPLREVDDPRMRMVVMDLIESLEPDLVHFHSLLNFSMHLPEDVRRAGVPSVYTSHNYWPICPRMYLFHEDLGLCSGPSQDGSKCGACIGRLDLSEEFATRARQGRKMLAEDIDRHLAISRRDRDLFVMNGHDASRVRVHHQVPETVDWIWQQVGSRRQPVERLARPLRVGFIGNLLPQKGAHVLISALQAFGPGMVEGHVYGAGPEYYVDQLRQRDGKAYVTFHGRYDPRELPSVLEGLDVVVIPSVWEEGAGLVVVEALAARCPVIGSRIGGIPDFIQDGMTGMLFDAGSAASLASKLNRFLVDRALLGRMQRNIAAPKRFETYLRELEEQYRDVLCKRPPESNGGPRFRRATNMRWEGSQFVRHSLALVNRELCLQVIEAGAELSIIPYEPDQFRPEEDPRFKRLAERVHHALSGETTVHVRHQWPPRFDPPPQGAWVMIQPWEFGSIPRDWVEPMCNQVDEIWVPSSFVKDGYVRSGVPAEKVQVIPNGVDVARFHPDVPPFPLQTTKRFKFLFVGGTIARKGIDTLLEVYARTFTAADDVCLVIKDMGGQSFYKGQTATAMIEQIRTRPGAPEIVYLDESLSDAELVGLYTACDALVHPYRGEGFALPIAEAMACGLPVIVTGYGACLEYCDSSTAFLIPAREIPLETSALPESARGYWCADVDQEAFGRLMLEVLQEPEKARRIALAGMQQIRDRFQWSHAAEKVVSRVEELARRVPVRFQEPRPFRLNLKPFPIEGRRQTVFFHHPTWKSPDWREVVARYTEAFTVADEVSLVLWLDPDQGVTEEEAAESLMAVLAEKDGAGEHSPDLILVPNHFDLEGLARLYAAADWIVPAGDPEQTQRALDVGRQVLTSMVPEDWRRVLVSGKDVLSR